MKVFNVSDILTEATTGPEKLEAGDLIAGIIGADPAECREGLKKIGGLRELCAASPSALSSAFDGFGETELGILRAVGEVTRRANLLPLQRGEAMLDGHRIYRAFCARLRDLKVEQFWVILLDGKHRVIREVLISQGTLTSSPVHPREVFTAAIAHSAAALIFVHNHPSGDPSPSVDDIEITNRLVDGAHILGLKVLDHIVIGDGYTSFRDRGILNT